LVCKTWLRVRKDELGSEGKQSSFVL
jgi:hypothetical protein